MPHPDITCPGAPRPGASAAPAELPARANDLAAENSAN